MDRRHRPQFVRVEMTLTDTEILGDNRRAFDNKDSGIAYFDSAGGVARGNECTRNWCGICIEETANPELVDNDCHDNTEADILDLRP